MISDIKFSWVEGKRLEIFVSFFFFQLHVYFSSLSYKFQTVKSIGDILYFKALFLLSAKINFNLA